MSKYDPLRTHLLGCGRTVTMSLDEVARLVGDLPNSARIWTWWWADDDPTHSQSRSWGDAGYSAQPDLALASVKFVKRIL